MYSIPFFNPQQYAWKSDVNLRNRTYECGFCSHKVSSEKGMWLAAHGGAGLEHHAGIRICPHCGGPTFFTNDNQQIPAASLGNAVSHVPTELNSLYEEARRCTTTACYTASVLLCRKMLMNIAVAEGAKEGLQFIEYVNFLSDKGYVTPKGKHWVDHIRTKGNEATHAIALMTEADARDLLTFIEMLLRSNYEFPARIQKPAPLVTPKTPTVRSPVAHPPSLPDGPTN